MRLAWLALEWQSQPKRVILFRWKCVPFKRNWWSKLIYHVFPLNFAISIWIFAAEIQNGKQWPREGKRCIMPTCDKFQQHNTTQNSVVRIYFEYLIRINNSWNDGMGPDECPKKRNKTKVKVCQMSYFRGILLIGSFFSYFWYAVGEMIESANDLQTEKLRSSSSPPPPTCKHTQVD